MRRHFYTTAFATDPDPQWATHAEPDTFFCFVELLSEFRDHFTKALDNSDAGVRATLSELDGKLKIADKAVWEHLSSLGVVPQMYAFRWITLVRFPIVTCFCINLSHLVPRFSFFFLRSSLRKNLRCPMLCGCGTPSWRAVRLVDKAEEGDENHTCCVCASP